MEEKRSGKWLFKWNGGEDDRFTLIEAHNELDAICKFKKWWERIFYDSHHHGLEVEFGEFDEDYYLANIQMKQQIL